MNLTESSNNFLDLWEEGSLCDVQLRTVDGAIVNAHRVVLAASSGFFRALFVGSGRQMREGAEDSKPICLTGVDEASLRALLKAVYSNSVTNDQLNNDTVLPLLAAASYLSVESVRDACTQYLHRCLSLETAVETLVLAERYDCRHLFDDAMRYLQAHLVPLMQSSSSATSLQLLSLQLLKTLLKSDELEVSGEADVAQAAALWVLGNVEERIEHIQSLLCMVRMTLLGDAVTAAVDSAVSIHKSSFSNSQINGFPVSTCSVDDIARVYEAFIKAIDQVNRASNSTSQNYFTAGTPRQGSPTQLMAVGGVDEGWRSLKTVELYDPRKDEWKIGPTMPAPCSFATACTLGTKAFAIEGSAHISVAQVYDRKKQTWEMLSSPCTARVNMAAAALPSCGVFVLGGRVGTGRAGISQRSVDRYNPTTGKWDKMATMKAPRTSLAACTVNNGQNIIAIGGQSDRATHDSAELFDPGRNEWSTLEAKMEFPRKYLGAAAVGGQCIAIGGMTAARQRLSSVEALDVREGKWRSLPSLSVPRSSCGVGVLHGEVFIAGGSVGEGAAYDGVEFFSVTAGKWRSCAPLALGRSGLAMTPV